MAEADVVHLAESRGGLILRGFNEPLLSEGSGVSEPGGFVIVHHSPVSTMKIPWVSLGLSELPLITTFRERPSFIFIHHVTDNMGISFIKASRKLGLLGAHFHAM